MKTVLIRLVLLSTLITACKKNQDADNITATVTFSKEALAFVQLPLNRFFIYKDSATSNFDSVVVTTSELSLILIAARPSTSLFVPAQPAYYAQRFKLELKLFNSNQTSWYNVSDNANVDGTLLTVTSSDLHALTLAGYDNFSGANTFISGIGFSYNPISTNILQSLSVEGKSYTDVFKYVTSTGADSDSAQSWYYKSIYYWVKGIGIIKRIEKNNKGTVISNLVRFGG